jgi:hypothetical protein
VQDHPLCPDEAWLVGEHRMSGEKKYYLSNLPAKGDLRTLAATIKARWICEQAFGATLPNWSHAERLDLGLVAMILREHGGDARRRSSGAIVDASKLASVGRFMRQATYNPAQHGLLHRFGCFVSREPLDLALLLFWPLLALPRHLQREHAHFTDHEAAVLKALFISE